MLDCCADIGWEVIAISSSQPLSARLPQFNKEPLERGLRENDIQYVFLGRELGTRRNEPECYVDGQARYDLVAKTAAFANGLLRVRNGVGEYNVALLCAEEGTIDVPPDHFSLPASARPRFSHPAHSRGQPAFESHEMAEERLLQITGDAEPFLFSSRQEQIERAYDRQGLKIAYRQNMPELETQPALAP